MLDSTPGRGDRLVRGISAHQRPTSPGNVGAASAATCPSVVVGSAAPSPGSRPRRDDERDAGRGGPKYVYDFDEGDKDLKDLKDLLGGKGANLAEMTRLDLPVPPGFTITTEACKAYLTAGEEPVALADEVSAHLRALEARMGRRLGQPDNPLLVSVRSGAKFSMPGMMETILNVGLNDQSVSGLAGQADDGGSRSTRTAG
nr:PEP/pyruvate-binding domain-containing protein [Pseudofrankia asymbiotica]